MKQEVREQWLKALRSGEYKQGREMLQSVDGQYCCLGVLCDLYRKEVGGTWSRPSKNSRAMCFTTVDNYATATRLPMSVVSWAGLDSQDPFVKYASLSAHNDGSLPLSYPKTFSEIADLIEENL